MKYFFKDIPRFFFITFNRLLQLISFLVLLFFTSEIFASELTSVEQHIANSVKKSQNEQRQLLKQLVNINSGTANVSGVYTVGEKLRSQFQKIGFKTTWVKLPASMKKAPTLVAEKIGTKPGPKILLIGHLDTVFAKSSRFKKYRQQGNFATGPGIVDDKGGDVIILYALKALHNAKVLDTGTITVILTGDEEDTGKPITLSRKALFSAAQKADVALDFEMATDIHTAATSRRGVSSWQLTTHGTQTHSSEIFKPIAGYGAVFEISRILNTLRAELSSQKYLSFNPGIILGGTDVQYNKMKSQGTAFGKTNVIAKSAFATGDLRYLSLEQKNQAIQAIQKILATHLPGTGAEIAFVDGMPAMPSTLGNENLLKKYSQVNQDLGYGPVHQQEIGSRGAGDISIIADKVSANLIGLGAVGSGIHSEYETLDLKSLTIQTQKTAILIYRLLFAH